VKLFKLATLVAAALVLPGVTDARGHGGGHSSSSSSSSHSGSSHSSSHAGGSHSSTSHTTSGSHSHTTSSGSTSHHGTRSHHGPKHGSTKRDPKQREAFMKAHPCPSTGKTSGACPGYVVDHVQALKHGGADSPSNMQWQTKAEAKAKDKWE
jgi:hypothetical protein